MALSKAANFRTHYRNGLWAHDVEMTTYWWRCDLVRRIDVIATSLRRHVHAGVDWPNKSGVCIMRFIHVLTEIWPHYNSDKLCHSLVKLVSYVLGSLFLFRLYATWKDSSNTLKNNKNAEHLVTTNQSYTPAGTLHRNDVVLTLMRRRHVVLTSVRRHYVVMCLMGQRHIDRYCLIKPRWPSGADEVLWRFRINSRWELRNWWGRKAFSRCRQQSLSNLHCPDMTELLLKRM